MSEKYSFLPGSHKCPGWPCHSGDMSDFDHFIEINGIAGSDVPDAFASWLNLFSNGEWTGEAHEVTASDEPTDTHESH